MGKAKAKWGVGALERQGAVTLAALGDRAGDRVRVVTEDGRAFRYPEARLLWKATAFSVIGSTSKEVSRAVRHLRSRAGQAPDWEALHGDVAKGEPLDVATLAGGGSGEDADGRALTLVLAVGEGAPWFRLERGLLMASTAEEMAAERQRIEVEARRHRSEEALLSVFSGEAAGDDIHHEALQEVLAWTLGPPSDRPDLAKRLGFADADDALEKLDGVGLLPADALAPVTRRGIPREFSLALDEAVAAVIAGDDEAVSREDLTGCFTIAIDDDATVEVDDAISLRRGSGGEPILQVHIADVAAAIEPGSPLDREACRRATTVYLAERRIPMFPPQLNTGRLSLDPGEARAAVTLEVTAGPGGAPEFVGMFRSTIRVDRRMNYAETEEASGLPGELRPLADLAQALRDGRIAAGARILALPSPDLSIRDGKPVLGVRRTSGCGDLLVGEAMVAMNRGTAERLRDGGQPCLWRVQAPPKGDLPPADDPLFPLKARRLFAPAHLSAEPGPHSGIGAPCYLQATSPIRRYVDLLHQRQLVALLEGRDAPHAEEEVRELGPQLRQREREARMAERDREAYWMARLLQSRGETPVEALCSRPPHRGKGHAWIPEMLQEMVVRWPPGVPGAAEGDPLTLRPGRLAPHRGRVEWVPER